MNEELLAAAVEVARLLDAARISYMVIGGVANLFWGAPRTTIDVDVSVLVDKARWPEAVRKIRAGLKALPADPLAFVSESHLLPCRTAAGVRVDIAFALFPLEAEAIRRAVRRRVGKQTIRVCTAEDLILYKIVSDRPRDLEDVRGVLRRMGRKLDRRYLDPKVKALAEMLERPELAEGWRAMLKAEGLK